MPLLILFFLEVGEWRLVEWEGRRANCSDGSCTRRGSSSDKRRCVDGGPGVVLNDLVKSKHFSQSSGQLLHGRDPALIARVKA